MLRLLGIVPVFPIGLTGEGRPFGQCGTYLTFSSTQRGEYSPKIDITKTEEVLDVMAEIFSKYGPIRFGHNDYRNVFRKALQKMANYPAEGHLKSKEGYFLFMVEWDKQDENSLNH